MAARQDASKRYRRLATTLESQLTESDSGQFEVGEQRERNHRYYTMQPIGNEVRGRSHYISPDVLESVENRKALFKETFQTGRKVVWFEPVAGALDEDQAKTSYCHMVMKRNNQSQLFRDGWHDAFVAKRMVTMTEWKEQSRTETFTLDGANQQQVMQILGQLSQRERIVSVDSTGMQGMNGVASGELRVDVDDSFVCVTLCMPERYYRDPNAAYPDDALWNTYEEDTGRGELKSMGYDPDQIDGLTQDYRWRSEEEDSARKAHDRSWTRRRQHNRAPEQDMVSYYRTWTWLNLWEHEEEIAEEIGAPDEMALYEIHWAQGEILRWSDGTIAVREAEEQPFNEWTEYKVSHAEHGMADADIGAHTQKVQSTLKRLVIDNQQMRNSSRWSVLQSSLKNPRDLLDNRVGGIIWTKRHDAVQALDVPELSPLTMSVIGMMNQDSNKRSGFSDVATGMSTDAVRYQNAEGLIDKMITAGSRRPMSAVRDWAETFLVPLYQKIVRTAMDRDRRQYVKEEKGRPLVLAPSTWIDTEMNMAVAKALTPEEGYQLAGQLLLLHNTQNMDPDMKMLYTVQQKYAMFNRIYSALGVDDTSDLMIRPDSPQFIEAFQSQMQQMQMQQAQMAEQSEFQKQLMVSNDRRLWEELNMNATDKMADNMREDDKLSHQVEIDWAEFSLESEQNRQVKVG